MDPENWITHVSLQGRIVELYDDRDLVDIDRIATHYTGQQYRVRDRARVTALVDVERWHGWGRIRGAT
ncbi:hypothetical protein [Terrabacter sp. 2RAF25]|uniref:hypothetical protein n=1 Tax=Terrabacter sp. 2RAF25 TaxID=3232998 RepID=UPI003F9B80F9